jgi:TP901 family phage tail tape measure protein
MSRFVLTAQLQLQAPNNVAQVVRQIQSQLNNVNVNIQVQNSQQAQRQLQQITQSTNQATGAADRMGRAFAASIRRFAAFSIATRAVGLFTSTLSDATQTAIDFERQLIKIAQVTGKSVRELRDLTNEITNLSTGLGVSSQSLLEVSTILAQAGLSANDTKVALNALAKAALAPNFDSITETAEGAIAILAQFGQGVEALESQLGSINAVAGAFAVEASDLIDVIRRTGGVFKSSGGSLNELLALFTSVRATTRESAESIGTGLRTIFTRIQRPKTIEFLKQFGVELLDLEGKFVGPFEAVRRLSEGLAGLGERDITFIKIAEELGGFRQIGKVLPLLQQFATAEAALNVATKANNSLSQDAASAQAALAIRITKVKEEFLALVRGITETSTFQIMANTALALASSLIKLADSIKPLLPLLTAMAAVRVVRGLGGFLGGIGAGLTSGRTFNKGGKVHHFARGGMVPGTGNRDTVPAMLSPGEFVIRKSSVNKLGAGNLAAMNENKYAAGGIVSSKRGFYGAVGPDGRSLLGKTRGLTLDEAIKSGIPRSALSGAFGKEAVNAKLGTAAKSQQTKEKQKTKKRQKLSGEININPSAIGGFFLRPNQGSERDYKINRTVSLEDGKYALQGNINGFYTGKNDVASSSIGKIIREEASNGLRQSIQSVSKSIQSRNLINVAPIDGNEKIFEKSVSNLFKEGGAQSTIEGYMLEGVVSALSGATLAGGKSSFDYPSSSLNPTVKSRLASIFRSNGEVDSLVKADAKRTGSPNNYKDIGNKLVADLKKGNTEGLSIKKFATGGGVGTDTVPALLTPGEFVVNRASAQSIGYGNLNRMNKVGKYANGGVVQKFQSGGTATYSGSGSVMSGSGNLIPFDTLSRQARNLSNSQQQLQAQTTSSTSAVAQNTQSQQQESKSITESIAANKMFAASMATMSIGLLQSFLPALDENSSALTRMSHGVLDIVSTLATVGFALQAFGVSLNAKQIISLFGSGPGGIGSIISNAFKGFKMGSAGMSGPMPLGGGVSSKAGEMFGKAKDIYGTTVSKLNEGLKQKTGIGKLQETISSSFRYGMQEKSAPLSRTGAFARVSEGLGGAGRFRQGVGDISARAGSIYGRASNPVSDTLGRFTKGLKLGSTNKFSLQNILSGQGSKAGFSGKLGGVIGKGAGTAGNLLGKIPGVGAAGRFAAGTAARVGAAGGLGAVGAAAAGPALAVAGVIATINNVIGNFRNLDSQLKKSIETGKVEEAARLAVAQKASEFPLIGNIVGSIFGEAGDAFLIGVSQLFGGSSLESIKALAASQAGAVKTQKELEQAQKVATGAMEDFANGSISASDALTKIRAATSGVADQQKRSGDFAVSNLQNRGGMFRDIATLGGMLGETSTQRNERLGKESADQIKQSAKFQAEAFQTESPARQAMIRSGFARGRSKSEIEKEALGPLQQRAREQRMLGSQLQAAGDETGAQAAFDAAKELDGQIQQVNKELANLEKEVARAKAAFDAMNLGLRGAESISTAMSASMERFAAGFEVGGDMFTANAQFLSEAMSSAAESMDPADIKSAVSSVSDNLSKMGVSPAMVTKFETNTDAFIKAQQNYNQAFANIKDRIKGADFTGMSADKLKDEFAKELTVGLGDEAKGNLTKIIQGIELSDSEVDAILGGNLQVFGDKLGEAGKKQMESILKIAEERRKAEQVLIGLTQKRIESERKLAEAQKEAFDLYQEGREIQAGAGGAAVTGAEKRGVILGKANVGASKLGLNELKTGSAQELRQRNLDLVRRAGGFEGMARTEGGLQGVGGVEAAASQQDLQQAYKEQVNTIRSLIKLEQDELKIIQEKNKLEKQSLESLITGDIEKFFEQQAAVGATAAIATGNQDLMNQFGASALAGAFSDIQRQQEAGVQSIYGQQIGGAGGLGQQAAGAALAARGIQSPMAAQMLAGTTPEEEARRANIRELGGVLSETGQVAVDMAQMELNTAEIIVSQANIKLQEINERGVAAAEKATGMWRGGPVYASNGMFVPRGTDTVPAMLTPGEFVVNRGAVNRGNNLQILRAINNGSSPAALSRGGKVSYYNNGGVVQYKALGDLIARAGQSIGIDPKIITNLGNVFTSFTDSFNASIKNLQDTKFQIKLDTTNINVNLNGGSFLENLASQIKQDLVQHIGKEISQYKVGSNGSLVKNSSTLPTD